METKSTDTIECLLQLSKFREEFETERCIVKALQMDECIESCKDIVKETLCNN